METLHSKILKAFNKVDGLSHKDQFKVWKRELREHDITCDVVNLLDGVPQYTYYHPEFDALLHTFYVCKAIMKMGRPSLLETAFLHDVGKAFTTNIGDKRIYHFGHPDKSVEFIESIKYALKYYDETCRVTKEHMNSDKALIHRLKTREKFEDNNLYMFIYADKILSKELYEKEHNFIDKLLNKLKENRVHYKQRHSKKEVYIMIGISGSGKSHYIKNIDSKYVVCPDDIRWKHLEFLRGKNPNNPVFGLYNQDSYKYIDYKDVWTTAVQRIKIILAKYGKVYFDATNVVKFSRIKFMSQFNDCKKIAVVFDTDVEVAISRVIKDIENNVKRADVPEKIIRKQYKNFRRGSKYLSDEYNKVIYI